MKKIILLFLFSIVGYSQSGNGTEFKQKAYQSTSPQTVTTITGIATMGPTGVIGSANPLALPVSTLTQTALNLKANIASPSLTGTPLAPTATSGNSSTQIATTAFVQNAISTDTNVMHLSTNESFTGVKSSVNTGTTQINGFSLTNNGTTTTSFSLGIVNGNTGYGSRISNTGMGLGSYNSNTSAGVSIWTDNFSTGVANVLNSQTGSTGALMQFRKNNAVTTSIDQFGVLSSAPSVTASSALARSQFLNPILTAAANNDVLIALDIAPTFTLGAFTGTSTAAIRVNGNIAASSDNSVLLGLQNANFSRVRSRIFESSTGNALFSTVGAFDTTIGANSIEVIKILNGTRNVIVQNGGTFTDNGVDRLQVAGTISASAATTANQVPIKSQLDLKADLASPSLTGTPTAPTAAPGNNSTQVATTAFVTAATASLSGALLTTTNQSFTGIKSSTNTGTTPINGISLINNGTTTTSYPFFISNTNSGNGMRISNSGSGNGQQIDNSATGIGTQISNNSSFFGLFVDNASTGSAVNLNSQTSSTGDLLQLAKNGSIITKVDQNGILTTPTATFGNNTTQVATTAFVQNANPSNTYTPTLTAVSNVAALSLTSATYSRVGNVITARVGFSFTATLIATLTTFDITFPIARAVSTNLDCGNGAGSGSTGGFATIVCQSTTTTTFRCFTSATTTNAHAGSVVIQYYVL